MLISIILTVLTLLIWYYKVFYSMKRKLNWVPKPKGSLPVLGNILDFTGGSTTYLDTFLKYINTYGTLVNVQLASRQLILAADRSFLEFILSSNSGKMLEKSVDYKFIYNWVGEGLLTAKAPKWKVRRRLLLPAFHFQLMERFIEVFDKNSKILVNKWNDLPLADDGVDIYPYFQLHALDVISESAMGVSIEAQQNKNCEYVESVREMCRILIERSFSPIEMYDCLYRFTKNKKIEDRCIKIIYDHSMAIIRRRMADLYSGDSPSKDVASRKKTAFLDLLLQIRIGDEGLPINDIRDEVDTFMFEGHDTTSSSLSFTVFLLASYLDEQEKAFEEQQTILGPDSKTKCPSVKQLDAMTHLDHIIKESLRLYPIVPFFGRRITEDVEYKKGQIIPKNTTITIFAYGINRDPEYFENPDEFIPSRFESSRPSPCTYLPFSAGPRNCIGRKFAMNSMKFTLSKLIRNFEFLPTIPEHKLVVISETVLKSSNGFRVRIKNRE